MLPWPIALLALFYGAIAAVSGVALYKSLNGLSQQAAVWPGIWLGASAGATYGLILLRPWARPLTIAASMALSLVTLGIAAALVATSHPLGGLAATLGAGVHVLIIRYLRRPMVRTFFSEQ